MCRACVAQEVERRSYEPQVASSNPVVSIVFLRATGFKTSGFCFALICACSTVGKKAVAAHASRLCRSSSVRSLKGQQQGISKV